MRSNGLIAMGLDEDDYLGWVRPASGKQDLILVTRKGMSIRFNEQDVRVMGRPAAGVSAIRLRGDDEVAGMDVIDDPREALLVVTEYGYGKRTPLGEYSQQRRYGFGVHTLRNLQKTGRIIGARVVTPWMRNLEKLGVTLRFRPVDFALYQQRLQKFDFDVNQISITPAREKVVDFSAPYYTANQAVLVKKGSDLDGITSLDELKDATIGVQIGTTSLDAVNEQIDPSTAPKVFDNSNDVVTAFKQDQVDAIVVDTAHGHARVAQADRALVPCDVLLHVHCVLPS